MTEKQGVEWASVRCGMDGLKERVIVVSGPLAADQAVALSVVTGADGYPMVSGVLLKNVGTEEKR